MGLPNEVNSALIGAAAAGGYEIEHSLRFTHEDNAYLSRSTGSVTPTNEHIFTTSVWVKYTPNREAGGNGDRKIFGSSASNTYNFQVQFGGNDASGNNGNKISVGAYPGSPSTFYTNLDPPSGSYRNLDPAAWMHIVFRCDTTQATDSNRIKMWVNGEDFAPWTGTVRYPAQNSEYPWNDGASRTLYIGYTNLFNGIANYFDGYMAEFHNVDGQALSATDFGEFDPNGVWRPIQYTGTYGNQGFYLKFDPSATNGIGHDHSGNGLNWTANNFTTSGTGTDCMSDSPTNNYATLNPLFLHSVYGTTAGRLDDANLTFVPRQSYSGNWGAAFGTIRIPNSGKYYFEVRNRQGSNRLYAGFFKDVGSNNWRAETGSNVYSYYSDTGNKVNTSNTAYGAAWDTANDVAGCAIDMDGGTITFYKNGVSQGTAFSSLDTTGDWFCRIEMEEGSGREVDLNFGARGFDYTIPSGYKALSTKNYPAPAIKKPKDYFSTLLYTGDNTNNRALTGLGHQPNFTWIKNRSRGNSHVLQDSVRGISGTNGLQLTSNRDFFEGDNGNGHIGTYGSDGFTLVDGTSTNYPREGTNNSGDNYAAFSWVESSTAGFDIVTYSGSSSTVTVSHGLGVTPEYIIVKCRNTGTTDWMVWGTGFSSSQGMNLNNGDGRFTSGSNTFIFNVGSSSFQVGTSTIVNGSGRTFVAYVFAGVEQFSKFGIYQGNSNNDGHFQNLGFRPAFLMIGGINSGSWQMYNSSISGNNPAGDTNSGLQLEANNGNNPSGEMNLDLLSNGFKCRTNNTAINDGSRTYLYMAFAEFPFGGGTATPALARGIS